MYRKRVSQHRWRVMSAGAFFFFLCAAAPADTIFSDFGPVDASQIGGYCVDGATPALTCSSGLSAGSPLAPAALFTPPPGNYDLTQIDLGLVYNEGTNGLIISLSTDASGVPGALVGSWDVSGQPPNSPPVTTVSGITGITLTGGENYFLEVSPIGSDTNDTWTDNSIGVTGTVYDPPFGGSGLTLPAFDVLGTPVAAAPEPGPLAICAAALLGLMAYRRKRSTPARG